MSDGWETVSRVVEEAASLGVRDQEDGTRLYGSVPSVAPDAWLHVVFRPATDAEIVSVERALGRSLPSEYSSFLRRANGLHLFSGLLSLDGVRLQHDRKSALREPFSLETVNRFERPPDSSPTQFFVGGYAPDGSLLLLDEDGSLHRCARDSVAPLNSWESLDPFLAEEVLRLRALFDRAGKPLKPRSDLVPS